MITTIFFVFLFYAIAYTILFLQSKSAGETNTLRVVKLIIVIGAAVITSLLFLSNNKLSMLNIVAFLIIALCISLISSIFIVIRARKISKRRSNH